MAHTCQNLFIHCMDFRLGPVIKDWLAQKGYLGDVDEVSVAGACKEFVSEQSVCISDYLFRQIQLSAQLHGISRVILSQHRDCGAYGGEIAFASPEAERLKLVGDMKKLKEKIKVAYPQFEVSMVLLNRSGESWEIEEVID